MAETFPYVEGAGEQGLTIETAVFPETLPMEVPSNLEEVATQAAVVEATHSGKPIDEQLPQTTQNIETLGIDETRRSIARLEQELELRLAEDSVRTSPNQDTAAYYAEVLRKHEGPPQAHALEMAVVDTITSKTSEEYFSEFTRRENAKDLAARNIIYQTLGKGPKEGWYKNPLSGEFWNTVLALGRDMVGFINPRALSKSAAEALGRKHTWGDIFSPDEVINEFRNAYIGASEDQRVQLVQALIHGLQKTSSLLPGTNEEQVAINLGRILEQSKSETDFNTLLDVAGLPVVTTAGILVKAARAAKDIGRPALVAIRSGNPELAVELVASDAIRKTSTSGMSSNDIARMATSMNMTPMELSLVDLKVAQPLQEKLKQFAQRIRDDVKNTLMPSNITPVQIAKGAEYYEELYSAVRNKAVYDYRPTGYEDGMFTGSIKWQTPEGLPFSSKEAAEEFGRDLGKIGVAERVNVPNKSILVEHYPGISADSVEFTDKVATKKRVFSKKGEFPGNTILADAPAGTFRSAIKKDKQGRYYYDETTYEAPPGEWVFNERMANPLPIESIGTTTLADVSGRNFWNFNIPLLSASIATVRQAGLSMSANAKLRRSLETAYKDAIKPLSGKERGQVHQALVDGDSLSNVGNSEGHVFDAIELGARGLSEKAIESYYKLRILRDSMWLQRNKQMMYELRSQGMKEFAFDGNEHVGPLHIPTKVLDVGATKSMNTQGKIGKVLDLDSGKVVNLTSDMIDALYSGGGRVMRFQKPQVINGRKFTHIMANEKTGKMRDISTPVPYRSGEFARSYTDEYFITMQRNVPDEFDRVFGSPGYEGSPTATVRTAKNAREAEIYAARHNEAIRIAFSDLTDLDKLRLLEQQIGKWTDPKEFLQSVKSGQITPDAKFDFHYNRDTHSYLQDTIDENLNSGRLFTSKRGNKLLSVNPNRQNTLDVFESLGVELANISRYVTSKDIRVDAIERWMNSFGHGLVNPSHNKMADFTHQPLDASKIKEGLLAQGSDLADLSSAELIKFAESERKYIKTQLNIRTQAQKTNAETYRRATEFIESGLRGLKLDKMADWFGPMMRQTDVPDTLRRINFNITLAMGNLTQIIVQANGMMIAAGRHPIHGLPAAKTAIALRLALMSDNPDFWKTMATVDNLTSLGLKNVNEFADSVAAIRKSGILDDIRSTAMFNVEDGALDLYKGYGRDVLRKASTFGFDRGEEFARLVSWEIARREWKAANPGKPWTADSALREISIKQKEYNLGMQSYNTAAWQKGLVGIPMQFLQYNVKLAASVLHATAQLGKDINKRGWKALTDSSGGNYRGTTPRDAFATLATQTLIYGVAGNGLRGMANEIWGNESGLTTEEKMYLSEGLAGGVIYSLTKELDEYGQEDGAKLALGSRLGSFNWYEQIYDKITTDRTSTSDFLLGVTKSNGIKVLDHVRDLARLFSYEETSPELVMDTLSKFPEIIASWGNVVKAYTYMQNEGKVTSKDGTPIARLNSKENLAAFLGISSVQVQEYYETVKDQNRLLNTLKEVAKEVHKLRIRQWDAIERGEPELAEALEKLRWSIIQDTGHREFIDRYEKSELWPGDTASDKIKREFVDKMNQESERFRVLDKGTQ